jgi:colanic acid/amylovoran biosynthesis glycosyltransferase
MATGSVLDHKSKSRAVNLCVATSYLPSLTETFIRAHIEQLPANVTLVHGWRPRVGNKPVLSWPMLVGYKAWRTLTGADLERETAAAYLKLFRERQIDAVLAEYGEMGVQVMNATIIADIPLIVHFHGYDASLKSVLEQHRESYPRMFQAAAAIIAVSRSMYRKLIELGAPEGKVHYNPYGVDCNRFGGAKPGEAPPIFIAVGRFTDKKAPHNTISAFSEVVKTHPEARLRMVGDGALLEQSQRLAADLNIADAITFLGPQDPTTLQAEMRAARCFVQHSIEAASGDSEGTPLSILEAGATGLPVVSTRHAGIPDVVIEGRTGFLVDEGDVKGMAKHMSRLASDTQLAQEMGQAARDHVRSQFNTEKSLGNLWRIIQSCMPNHREVDQINRDY